MKRLFTFALTAMVAFVSSMAQQSQPIPVDPAVRIGTLDNGLTYYIRHNAEPQGQANFYIAQKVGSILEEENQRGLAHFLEHMCFNGTKHFPGNGVIKYCEKEGGTYSIGAYGDLGPNPAPRTEAYMQIPYQASPDKYEYLNQRVRDIVAQFVAEGPSAENIAKGKEYFLKNHIENLRENSYWANALETYLDTKVDITRDFEQTLQRITVNDARLAIEQLMKQNNHTEVIMVGVTE